MSNFNNISYDSIVDVTLNDLRAILLSLAKFIGSDVLTGLPNEAKRYNSSNNKFEAYNSASATWSKLGFHTTIDDHIANQAIHAGVPIGTILIWPTIFLPSATYGEWKLCDGSAISRATYADLFGILSTAYGVGDGSTTFNIPNFQMRMPIGMSSLNAQINALGKTTGAMDHQHTQPGHVHTINSHTHGMGNHTHGISAHTHTVPDHGHLLPPHFHYVDQNGADIRINTSEGQHQHRVEGQGNSAPGNTGRAVRASAAGGANNELYTVNDTLSAHGHSNASFDGRVGNVNSLRSGDDNYASFGSGVLTTGSSGGGNTGAPSNNTSDGSGTLTTNSAGAETTGANNPPMLTVNFIIKVKL